MCGNRLGLIIIHGFGHHPAPLLGYLHGNQRKFRNQYESGAPPHCAAGAVKLPSVPAKSSCPRCCAAIGCQDTIELEDCYPTKHPYAGCSRQILLRFSLSLSLSLCLSVSLSEKALNRSEMLRY